MILIPLLGILSYIEVLDSEIEQLIRKLVHFGMKDIKNMGEVIFSVKKNIYIYIYIFIADFIGWLPKDYHCDWDVVQNRALKNGKDSCSQWQPLLPGCTSIYKFFSLTNKKLWYKAHNKKGVCLIYIWDIQEVPKKKAPNSPPMKPAKLNYLSTI